MTGILSEQATTLLLKQVCHHDPKSIATAGPALALVLACAVRADGPGGVITPTDVYRKVQDVAHDVEAIRFYMGRPANGQEPINVSGVAPSSQPLDP